VDANANGRQDRDEPGLPDIRLATEEGVTVTTDTDGRYHFPEILPGRHVLKLDQTTLPPGATLTTEHTRLVKATDGSLSKVNFGVRLPQPKAGGRAPLRELSVTQLPAVAQPELGVSVSPATPVLTKQGTFAEPVTFTIACNYSHFIRRWVLAVATKREALVKTFSGEGPPPTTFQWDGRLDSGRLTPDAYRVRLFVWDADGREDFTALQTFDVMAEPGRR